VDCNLGPVSPNGYHDLEKPGGPIRAQVEGLVGIVAIIGHVQGMLHGMNDVGIIEPVILLVLSSRESNFHLRVSYHENRDRGLGFPVPSEYSIGVLSRNFSTADLPGYLRPDEEEASR